MMESDGLLVQTLFSIQKTILLAQETSVQAACITNVLQTWSQLLCHRNANVTASAKECDMIHAFLFDFLKTSAHTGNVSLQNVAVHAIMSWIHEYLPRIRRMNRQNRSSGSMMRHKKIQRKPCKPSAAQLTAFCSVLLQMQAFTVEPQSVAGAFYANGSAIDSYELVFQMLQQIVDARYAFEQQQKDCELSNSVWRHLKYILCRIVDGCARGPSDACLLLILQVIRICSMNSTASQAQVQSHANPEIDQIANICYSMVDRYHPSSSQIGAVISGIAQTHCFRELYARLPHAYRIAIGGGVNVSSKAKHHNTHPKTRHGDAQEEVQKYQSQLQSLLQATGGDGHGHAHVHARAHPLRVFESSHCDLSDQLNHISLDIRRRNQQNTISAAAMTRASPHSFGYGCGDGVVGHGHDAKENERDELLCGNGNNSEAELMRCGRKRNWTNLQHGQVDDDSQLLPDHTFKSPLKKIKYHR